MPYKYALVSSGIIGRNICFCFYFGETNILIMELDEEEQLHSKLRTKGKSRKLQISMHLSAEFLIVGKFQKRIYYDPTFWS